MKKMHLFLNMLLLFVLAVAFSGCRRNSNEVWEDTKTAGRHVNRGVKSFAGKHGDSRAVRSRDEFYPQSGGGFFIDEGNMGNMAQNDFVPLADYQNPNEMAVGEYVAPQPRETPGDPGSSIPGIESFKDPSTNQELARVFKNINFDYNSSLVKGDDNLRILRDVSNYMRSNPNTYVFVEGHCCEKGPESYNLALGTYRSNSVRNALISDGVDPDHIFTISYGKERPIVLEHHEEAWAKNRRAEFKIYQR